MKICKFLLLGCILLGCRHDNLKKGNTLLTTTYTFELTYKSNTPDSIINKYGTYYEIMIPVSDYEFYNKEFGKLSKKYNHRIDVVKKDNSEYAISHRQSNDTLFIHIMSDNSDRIITGIKHYSPGIQWNYEDN